MENQEAESTSGIDARLANTLNLDALKGFELIKQGAEAKIYTGMHESKKAVAKERFPKTYRHPDLDRSLTRKRIRNEVKLLEKAHSIGVQVPKIFKVYQECGLIIMEMIDEATTCRDFIINLTKSDRSEEDKLRTLTTLSNKLGESIGKLHYANIIHGDLTTSNMLIKNHDVDLFKEIDDKDLYFIDFGLAFISSQLEDKAVDLYVLERALASTHSQHATFIFEQMLNGYRVQYKTGYEQVVDRFKQVRLRGRKRSMVG